MGTKVHNTISTTLAILIVGALLGAFGLHSIQIAHNHPGGGSTTQHQGESDTLVLGEYMHLSDKKLLFLIASIFSLGIVAIPTLFGSWARYIIRAELLYFLLLRRGRSISTSILHYLRLFFSNGVLHPKLY